MRITLIRVRQRVLVSALACIIASLTTIAHAHVNWTRVNGVDSDTIALYHFENATPAVVPPSGGLDVDRGLTVFTGASPMTITGDTPGTIFQPEAIALASNQTLRTTATVTNLAGDLTIESWFKWSPTMTSSTLEIGLTSGARLIIARDTLNPANDRLGVAGTHGSYITVPGFTNWAAFGEEEASLDEWRHIALAIHSTGIHFDTVGAHDIYSTGTTGLISLNGHPLGFSPFTFDLSGLKVHNASRLTVVMRGAGIVLDELTLWRRNWNANGSVLGPYGNGRGGQAGVAGWIEYNE